MTTNLPDIPQEVVHHIVSLLYSDKHTLKNCSLVSKRWLHPSRVYLFESVRIRDSTGLTEFLAFLATTGHINYVRRLFVSGIEAVDTNRIPPRESLVYAISLREASYGDCDDTTDLTPKQLSYLLTHLPVLRHLELEKFVLRKYYGPPDPEVDIRTSPKQHSLQTLEFRSCVFGSAESLFGILSLFRELEELSFNNQSHFTTLLAVSKEPIPDLWAPQLSLNPLKVTSLSFAFSPMLDSLDAVTNATVQFLDQDAIRSLVILNWGCTNYPVVRDLLRGMSPSLCSLTLDLTCLFRMVVPGMEISILSFSVF